MSHQVQKGKCIIVCAGDFTPIQIHKGEHDFVIAADGGYAYCQMVGLFADLILGDFDSVPDKISEEIKQIEKTDPERVCRFPAEKDDTDTFAAIRAGLDRGYQKFFFYGAMGGRLDHTIANLQCLQYLKNHGAKGYLMDLHTMITVIKNEEIKFHPKMEGTLSLFCMGERAEGVYIKNMKYELDNATLTNEFPVGISNEFLGTSMSTPYKDGSAANVYEEFEQKKNNNQDDKNQDIKEGTISVENGSLLVIIQRYD